MNLKIRDLANIHKDFLEAKGSVPSVLLALAKVIEEAGEVGEVIAAKNGSVSKTAKITKKQPVDEALLEELGDLVMASMTLMRSFGFEPDEVIEYAAAKVKMRTERILDEKKHGKK